MYAEKTNYDDIEMSSRLRNVLRRNGFESFKHGIVYNKNIGTVFRIQWKNRVVYDSGCIPKPLVSCYFYASYY